MHHITWWGSHKRCGWKRTISWNISMNLMDYFHWLKSHLLICLNSLKYISLWMEWIQNIKERSFWKNLRPGNKPIIQFWITIYPTIQICNEQWMNQSPWNLTQKIVSVNVLPSHIIIIPDIRDIRFFSFGVMWYILDGKKWFWWLGGILDGQKLSRWPGYWPRLWSWWIEWFTWTGWWTRMRSRKFMCTSFLS